MRGNWYNSGMTRTVGLWERRRLRRTGAGQAMIEYVLATGILISFTTIMAIFLYALRLRADRVLSLIALDHP